MTDSIEALIEEITGFLKDEGYEVVDKIILDFGETVKLIIEKGDEKSILPIVECYYDTDSVGKLTKWHGVLDIRDTAWYKNRKNATVSVI